MFSLVARILETILSAVKEGMFGTKIGRGRNRSKSDLFSIAKSFSHSSSLIPRIGRVRDFRANDVIGCDILETVVGNHVPDIKQLPRSIPALFEVAD
jgi:hypothetical protein